MLYSIAFTRKCVKPLAIIMSTNKSFKQLKGKINNKNTEEMKMKERKQTKWINKFIHKKLKYILKCVKILQRSNNLIFNVLL